MNPGSEHRHRPRYSASRLGVALVCMLMLGVASACRDQNLNRVEPATPAEAEIFADFQKRVNDYVTLHKKIENDLPAVPKDATPEQIDNRQRDLLTRIAAARSGAKQGDLFTPAMTATIRARFQQVFKKDRDGKAVTESVMDENPDMTISVNQRYPDAVPLSTMPPDVLEFLPKMPEELEFRFVGRHLIIMDQHAHLIVDYVPNAMPE
jgi:hypothetical protein